MPMIFASIMQIYTEYQQNSPNNENNNINIEERQQQQQNVNIFFYVEPTKF